MSVATIELTGIAEWRQQLSPVAVEGALQRGLRKGLQPAANAARALAPKRSGKMANSIRVTTSQRGGSASAAIVTGAPYGHLVESGHRMVTGGRVARSGQHITTRRLTGRVVGQVPPHPFARPAFEAHQAELVAAIEREMQATIEGRT